MQEVSNFLGGKTDTSIKLVSEVKCGLLIELLGHGSNDDSVISMK